MTHTRTARLLSFPVAMALATGLLAALMTPAAALAMPDTPANRRAQAEQYERAVPVERILEANIARVASLLPEEHRAPFAAQAEAEIDRKALRTAILAALTDTFTADELAAMTAFFGSDVGRSVSAKMTRYMHRVMPEVMGEVQAAATRYAQEHAPAQ